MLLDDFKDRQGNWVKVVYHRGIKKTVLTRCGRLWQGILSRCDTEGSAQKLAKSYEGTSCEFVSFNEFVEWAHTQVGFGVDGYQLDKDILGGGAKVYSPDTCSFVPREINLAVRKG